MTLQLLSYKRQRIFMEVLPFLLKASCMRKDILLDSVAPCGAMLCSKIHGFFLYVTHLLIFSKRVRGEMSFQRGKTIMT